MRCTTCLIVSLISVICLLPLMFACPIPIESTVSVTIFLVRGTQVLIVRPSPLTMLCTGGAASDVSRLSLLFELQVIHKILSLIGTRLLRARQTSSPVIAG